MERRYEFDEIEVLSAVAVGAPGKRTFFLIVGERGNWVRVWLEKEQLQALGLAIDQFLLSLSHKQKSAAQEVPTDSLTEDVKSRLPAAELEIDEIALGYDKGIAMLTFSAHLFGSKILDQAVVHCRPTLSHLKQLGDQAKNVCAAGRPRCAICGEPIDPSGHICPKKN